MKKYDKYKNSGVEWLGEIPEQWNFIRMKHLFKDHSEKNKPNEELLSVTQNKGVVPRTWVENRMVMPSGALESFKFIEKGDFAISLRSFEGGLEYCHHDGIISPAYTVLKTKRKINEKYYKYLFKSFSFISELQTSVVGIREGKNISFPELSYSFLPVPKVEEQTSIANFLDDKTAKIDQAITIKQKQIELLKERKQILIHKAVTRGLNDDVKLKDSGVEWIGEIPEHWKVKRLKDICSINLNTLPENTNKNFEFKYVDIGSVSLENGINNIEDYTFKNAPSRARRIAKKGDTVISTVRTYLKAIDFIDEIKSTYIYSTGFAVLQPKSFIYPEFLANFVRSDAFTEQVTVNSKGMSYPAINSADIGRLTVVHCELEEQMQIIEYIKSSVIKIVNVISLKEQEIEKLKEYKMCLIDGVVTGKVKVFKKENI
ncbi:restriction endonuclease subunit S [Flavobacterium sp. MEB061]|uniref:restriction endonuclease subunit S n=1 Tax=Flavobacterium sp. MEB061 TaxID=1587524 RepID=UPI0013F4A0D9|nr:restriction endonuclease subunit S [Flavobacterium sp. MEB061]